MCVQLQHVLAGERMRCGEEQAQALVDRCTLAIGKFSQFRGTRPASAANQLFGQLGYARPGNADNSDTAAARRCRNRCNGFRTGVYGITC